MNFIVWSSSIQLFWIYHLLHSADASFSWKCEQSNSASFSQDLTLIHHQPCNQTKGEQVCSSHPPPDQKDGCWNSVNPTRSDFRWWRRNVENSIVGLLLGWVWAAPVSGVILLCTTRVVPDHHACLVRNDGCGELVGGCWSPDPGENVGEKTVTCAICVRNLQSPSDKGWVIDGDFECLIFLPCWRAFYIQIRGAINLFWQMKLCSTTLPHPPLFLLRSHLGKKKKTNQEKQMKK